MAELASVLEKRDAMRLPRWFAVQSAAIGVLTASPVGAAILSVSQPEVAEVVAVTAGEETWLMVGSPAYGTSESVRVVPLPEGAMDVRLVPFTIPALGPKHFRVEEPPLCDARWSCETARAPVEPPDRSPPKVAPQSKPSAAGTGASPPPDRFYWEGVPIATIPPKPPSVLRLVERNAIEATVKELTARIPVFYYHGPDGGADIAARAPSVSRFAVVLGGDTVAFRMRGPFAWPLTPMERGGPKETVVMVLTAIGATALFPRALLRAEPPRLYLQPAVREDGRTLSPSDLGRVLADQLASEGKPIHLERAMPIEKDDRNEPNAGLVAAFGLRELPLPGTPRHFRLFRYRFRGVSDIGFSATSEVELPHPREIATAFVTVDSHLAEPGDPHCPGKFGACYRPVRHATGWRVEYGASDSFSAVDPGKTPHIVEAPYSLATPVMREPSPFPALAASRSASPAPSSSPGAPATEPHKVPVPHAPDPTTPGPRGCACDAVLAPVSESAPALESLALLAMWSVRRRRAARS
jgi:hypothetical protein